MNTERPNPDLLARLARDLAAEPDVDGVLRRVVDAAVFQLDGADHAGITVLSKRSVSTPVCSDDLVLKVDAAQYSANEGPCLNAALDPVPMVRVDDLRTDARWPTFAAAAVELGVLSMLSFQLYTEHDTIGALNIYADEANAFDDEDCHTGQLLATHAAVAAAAAVEAGNLRTALESRDVIGQAKGILMSRYQLTADQAFDLLITASQHTHRKLNDVASQLAATGELAVD
ncbi:MAG TPA: GAF and ANTAR domain-containing protein [Jatrophihabitans sp.]